MILFLMPTATNADLSSEMLAIAKEKCPDAKNVVLGATELDKLDEQYDGIIAIRLIQHLNKKLARYDLME